MIFFLLNVNSDWLNLPVGEWDTNDDFITVSNFVRTAKTVNDVAERAVKLMTDYASILTQDEEKRDWILQGVEANRRKYQDFHKNTLNA